MTLFSRFDWFQTHGDIPNWIIYGTQVVNTDKKFCLESTISAYPGAFPGQVWWMGWE